MWLATALGGEPLCKNKTNRFTGWKPVFIGDAEAVEKARRRFETRQRLTVIGS